MQPRNDRDMADAAVPQQVGGLAVKAGFVTENHCAEQRGILRRGFLIDQIFDICAVIAQRTPEREAAVRLMRDQLCIIDAEIFSFARLIFRCVIAVIRLDRRKRCLQHDRITDPDLRLLCICIPVNGLRMSGDFCPERTDIPAAADLCDIRHISGAFDGSSRHSADRLPDHDIVARPEQHPQRKADHRGRALHRAAPPVRDPDREQSGRKEQQRRNDPVKKSRQQPRCPCEREALHAVSSDAAAGFPVHLRSLLRRDRTRRFIFFHTP